MKLVIQRVKEAKVEVDGKTVAAINNGLLVFLGIHRDSTKEEADWLLKKCMNLRIFNDENQVMNKSLLDINGELLIVSQFTLHALTKKGNRPSYIEAASPDLSLPLYQYFVENAQLALKNKVQEGIFGADMDVHLVNDGPVTIIIDAQDKK
ncbi:MAG TPA: D-aminoacyl-tRNA deacylase [Chitinophagaceae bacterium]|nr:D-aminoacyl-tRNA deacylase [Chitinophagaceae bacterium]